MDKSTICIGDDAIRASFSVTDLGVVLDCHLNMSHHVSRMVQTCTYKLRLINVIRNKLTVTVAERVINAMVTGNLDYCNSLLNGITANEINRIQKLQNTAARLILKRDRRSSAIVMLNDLHWLSIKKREMYKILLFVYTSLHGTTPDYTTTRFNEYHPSRTPRSCEENMIVIQKTKLHYGDITFSVSATKWWNSIPLNFKCAQSVDSFKKCSKTYLFKKITKWLNLFRSTLFVLLF